jgi:2-C-methyl-D-erythritol 2,4-cyclodiphosphate synthase
MLRIGQGFDLHPLRPGRPLILAGVAIPYDRGLEGDSDADVALHALMDAELGALGLGDLGAWFPPARVPPGQSSLMLAQTVQQTVWARGWRVVNADLTIVAEKPRLAEFRASMTAVVADLLGTDAVSIKFKTADSLGVVGREQAMAALAVVLLELRPGSPVNARE